MMAQITAAERQYLSALTGIYRVGFHLLAVDPKRHMAPCKRGIKGLFDKQQIEARRRTVRYFETETGAAVFGRKMTTGATGVAVVTKLPARRGVYW